LRDGIPSSFSALLRRAREGNIAEGWGTNCWCSWHCW